MSTFFIWSFLAFLVVQSLMAVIVAFWKKLSILGFFIQLSLGFGLTVFGVLLIFPIAIYMMGLGFEGMMFGKFAMFVMLLVMPLLAGALSNGVIFLILKKFGFYFREENEDA